MISVIIPAYKEPLLQKTVSTLLENGHDIEVIVILDGWDARVTPHEKLRIVRLPENKGLRNAINVGMKEARGEWVMKCDAHCYFPKNFDIIALECAKEDTLVTLRRYSLNEEMWYRDERRYIKDHHYISFPKKTDYGESMEVTDWYSKTKKMFDIPIDEAMTIQGSCWIAHKGYFTKNIVLDEEHYGTFWLENMEISMKYWFGGGRVLVNKKTWYAHLNKRKHHYETGEYAREYKKDEKTVSIHEWATRYWMSKKGFEDFIKKFNPPGWNNWKKQ